MMYREMFHSCWIIDRKVYKPVQLGSPYWSGRQHYIAASEVVVKISCNSEDKKKKMYFMI